MASLFKASPRILNRARGLVFVDKPSGMSPGFHGASSSTTRPLLTEFHEVVQQSEGRAPHAIFGSQHEVSSSGVALVALERPIAAEVNTLWGAQHVEELYTALVRGRFPLGDVVKCNRRLCRPSEGSVAWRLAGSRRDGSEATTLLRGLAHGFYGGELCTLLELRPVTSLEQQLRLHCVALGHPIVGDDMHNADRRLDWRFEAALPSARLQLHCSHIRVPLAHGVAEATTPDVLQMQLRPDPERESTNVSPREPSPLLAAGVAVGFSPSTAWEEFAGGLSEHIIDDTHWDVPERARKFKGAPFGPPEWDERAAAMQRRNRDVTSLPATQ